MARIHALLGLAFLLCLQAGPVRAGEASVGGGEIALDDLLPPETLFYFERPASRTQDPGYRRSVLRQVEQHPEVKQFVQALDVSRQKYVQEIAQRAELEPTFVESVLDGRVSGALIRVDPAPGKDGDADIDYTMVLAVRMERQPDQKMLFDAIKAMVARWRQQYADAGEIPLKQPAWEERYPGGHTVMMIASESPLRFVLLGRTVLFFRGPKSEGLKTILANHDNPLTAKVLSKSPLYRSVRQGAESRPGMSFLYVNTVRLYSLLGAVRLPKVTRLLDVLGVNGVQALGLAGGYFQEGTRHTLYLHAPRDRRGVLKALSMKPRAEEAAIVLPAEAPGILAARAHLATLYHEIPLLVDAVEQTLNRPTPLGLAALAGQQTIVGVPAQEVLATLGDAVIIEPGPAGWSLRFDNADWRAFEAVVARMERSLGKAFMAEVVVSTSGEKRTVRYFNRSGQPIPVAPSYCVTQKRDNGTGVLYVASYPQTIKAILRHESKGSLQEAPDYKRVMSGMGSGYGVFVYVNNADSYARAYDSVLLPVLNAWCSVSPMAPDPGRLPPGMELGKHFFGCGLGIKNSPEGITFTAYSPLGLGGFGVFLVDKLLVSNPTAIGFLAAEIARRFENRPPPGPELDPTEGPEVPSPNQPKNRLPGIGGK